MTYRELLDNTRGHEEHEVHKVHREHKENEVHEERKVHREHREHKEHEVHEEHKVHKEHKKFKEKNTCKPCCPPPGTVFRVFIPAGAVINFFNLFEISSPSGICFIIRLPFLGKEFFGMPGFTMDSFMKMMDGIRKVGGSVEMI